jgi:hypothetical protein
MARPTAAMTPATTRTTDLIDRQPPHTQGGIPCDAS